MKAFVIPQYGTPDVLKLVNIPIPTPKEDEVLINVKAAAINDWDLGLVKGDPFILRLLYGFKRPRFGIPGTEVAGVIEAVGKNVKELSVGDEVYGDLSESGFGGFAAYVCARENALIKKPEIMSFEQAAAIPHAAELAYQGFILGNLESGQKILINGAGGGVGTLGIQLAKEYKTDITAVDHGDKLKTLKSIGFDQVIDYTKEDFTNREDKYDLILDTKTNRPLSHYARALKQNGRYITVGGKMRRILQIALLTPFIPLFTHKRFKVLSLKPNQNLNLMNDLFEQGKLQPLLEGPFPFESIPQLLERFMQGQHKGKIVINLD